MPRFDPVMRAILFAYAMIIGLLPSRRRSDPRGFIFSVRPVGYNRCSGGAHIMNTKSGQLLTKGGRSRQKIVETAAVLFNKKGFTGCSMGAIVTASGLEKGTLYSHFS